MNASERYEVVIGLEVHVQLRTQSKLFSTAKVGFGDAPNHNVNELCLALPGALPVLNAHAVELAVRAGLATHCRINTHSVFARKNYFYPDLPKGYQISQYEQPLCSAGWLDVIAAEGEAAQRIGITRIHMEEDAGKSLHEGRAGSAVDLNRSGVPLIEVVFEPDLRSARQAVACLRTLREILRYMGVSDGDMEKGQFRCDANVSLRRHGESALGTRREIKNLNSFRFAAAAIEQEVAAQAEILDAGGAVVQATLGYDVDKGRCFVMRSKENADDYRYFPDPDLLPLKLTQQRIEAIRATLPELPEQRRARFEQDLGLRADDARVLTASRTLADWFEVAALAHGAPQTVAKWVLRDVLGALRERDRDASALALQPEHFAKLLALQDAGRITAKGVRQLLPELLFEGGDPETLLRARGLEAVSDSAELEALVTRVLDENTAVQKSYAAGDTRALNFLMGKVMRETRGRADPQRVRALLLGKLER